MVKSKTKYAATNEEIKSVFKTHGITNIDAIVPLGGGEFNSAFKVSVAGEKEKKDYVIKLAPPTSSNILSYEKEMMQSEVFWYQQMKEHTTISVPKVYYFDFEKNIILTSYFIMEMMAGEPLWAVKMSKLEQKRVQNEKLQMLSQIHRIHNDKYGYKQSGLYESWYEAIYNMVLNLVNDCNRLGYETSNGRQLIKYIDLYKDILRKVPCCMVNFALWDSNVLYNEGQLVWIDPERSFWGDPIGDFITQGKGQKATLDEKKQEIEVYNQTAEVKLSVGREERIRYAIMVAYLALIEEVEKYVRYEPEDENYIRNTVDAKDMYDMAYSVLESSRKINMIRSTLSNKK